jgi:hypothetical protein
MDKNASCACHMNCVRSTYYAALHQPLAAEEFVNGIRAKLSESLAALEAGLAHKRAKGVRIPTKHNGWIQVSPFPPLPEPQSLGRLKQEINRRWPETELLDIFKEAALRTQCTDAFTTLASRETLDRETLQKRLLICLYGLGTNAGLRRLASAAPQTTYSDLRYVRRRYINKKQIRSAIATVANAIFRERLPQIWGKGRVPARRTPKNSARGIRIS